MHHAALLVGFAALGACSPAAQAIDFASVNSAPSPSLTGPAVGAATQYVTYNSAAVSSNGYVKAPQVLSGLPS